MNADSAIIILLIVNCILALIYLLWGIIMYKVSRKAGNTAYEQGDIVRHVIMFMVFLMTPVAGMSFYLMSFIFRKIFFHKEVDLSDVMFSKERVSTYEMVDVERERNFTSFEEAIAVSDYQSLRQLTLNVLRGDIQQSLNAVSLALNSADSETSHYAAAALRDELGQFRENVQRIYNEIMKNDSNCEEYCVMDLQYMNTVLKQKVLPPMEQSKYVEMMNEVGRTLYRINKFCMEEEYYEWLSDRLVDEEEYDRALIWCQRGHEEYPDRIGPYKSLLKLYYKKHDREKFFETMEELKKSDIVIDSDTLEMIRVFS